LQCDWKQYSYTLTGSHGGSRDLLTNVPFVGPSTRLQELFMRSEVCQKYSQEHTSQTLQPVAILCATSEPSIMLNWTSVHTV